MEEITIYTPEELQAGSIYEEISIRYLPGSPRAFKEACRKMEYLLKAGIESLQLQLNELEKATYKDFKEWQDCNETDEEPGENEMIFTF